MKFFTAFVFGFVVTQALATVSYQDENWPKPPKGDISEFSERAKAIVQLKGGVCLLKTPFGSGSAWAYKREGNKTYIMTAKHVVTNGPNVIEKDAPCDIYFAQGVTDIIETAYLHEIDETHDLASLYVINSKLNILELEKADWKPAVGKNATEVLIFGYPGGSYPPFVTYGIITRVESFFFETNANAYFGNSGGPIVRFDNLKVIGVVVALWPRHDIPRTDEIITISIEHVQEFVDKLFPSK